MDIITTLRNRLECKINFTLSALLPNKFSMTMQGSATSSENIRSKKAIPALTIIQGIAAIGGMMIKGVNALAGCQLDFVKKKVFLKGLIFKNKRFLQQKKKVFRAKWIAF